MDKIEGEHPNSHFTINEGDAGFTLRLTIHRNVGVLTLLMFELN
jgi:hypothetical protein